MFGNEPDKGCELLSEFSTFGISNNYVLTQTLTNGVVNCFQNLVPLVSATTAIPSLTSSISL